MKTLKIWQIRDNNKSNNYVVVDNKLILDRHGNAKRVRNPIHSTLVWNKETNKIGWAAKNPLDTFCRQTALKIAKGRSFGTKDSAPMKLRKHIKRMANTFGAEMPNFAKIEPKSTKVDWENVKGGAKLKLVDNWEDFEGRLRDFELDILDEEDFTDIVFESYGELWGMPCVNTNEWAFPPEILELA